MTYLSLFYIAAAIAQETTTQANDETTTVEPKKNNNCKFLNQLIVLFMVLTPIGKSTIQWSVWFWRFPKALLLKLKIIDISMRDVKFNQLSAGIKILMIWISYQGLIYRKLEGVQLFSERIII